jgi:hypothetical protein
MKWPLKHPLWVHLPAAAIVGALAVTIIRAWPFPGQMPLQFDFAGRPQRFGSPWEGVIAFGVICLLLLVGSIALDEVWAREEQRKRFNWLSLLDELVIGFTGGIGVVSFALLADGQTHFTMPWRTALALALAAATAAAVLEMFRPHRPSEPAPAADGDVQVEELLERMRIQGRWAWWESQNPWLLNLALGGGAALVLILSLLLPTPRPILFINLGATALMIGLCGGMRVSVTPERLTVRIGLLSIPVFRLRLQRIVEAAQQEFSPLADFGGWGIRVNRQMWAFFLRGRRGVRIRTDKGKQYLIGSDHPERLLAVLRAALPRLAQNA